MKHRVLVVEDHEWWRRRICAELDQTPHWEVVGAVSDGIEAVQKARALKPDLILLDIGLPGLDGLQVARRVLEHDPASRILFVTEQQSLDVAQAAMGTGARGFIVKSDVRRDLLPAMDSLIAGGRFIGAKMAGRGTRETWSHEAGFYTDESSLLDGHARFVEAALNAGSGVVMVFAPSRREKLHQRLHARGVDLNRALTEKRCLWLDVQEALSSFMVNGRVDERRFWNATSALVMEAARGSKLSPPHVSACGECAPALLQDGLVEAAVQLEQLWDRLARTFNVDIFCSYSCHCDDENKVFSDLRAAHTAVHV